MTFDIKAIRSVIRQLKAATVEPDNGHFYGIMSRKALIDIILAYKRPKATKIYRRTAVRNIIDILLTYKQPKLTRLYRSLS